MTRRLWNDSRLSTLRVCLVLLASFQFPLTAESNDDIDRTAPQLREEILSTWKARTEAIQTIQIRARFFRKGPSSLKRLNSDEVVAIVDSCQKLEDGEKKTKFLTEKLRSEKLKNEIYYAEVEFATDRQRKVESTKDNGKDQGKMVTDGHHDIIVDPLNKYVTIFRGGESRRGTLSLKDFAWEFSSQPLGELKLITNDNTTAHLRGQTGPVEIDIMVERATNLVRKVTSSRGGVVFQNLFQLGTLQFPDGLYFPEISLRVNYKDDSIYSATLLSPIEIDTNITLSDSLFTVSAPAGSRIVDAQFKEPKVYTISCDTKDVTVFVQSTIERDPRSDTIRPYIITLSAVTFLGLTSIVLFRRIRYTNRSA